MLIYLFLITVAKNTLLRPHQLDVYSQAIHTLTAIQTAPSIPNTLAKRG